MSTTISDFFDSALWIILAACLSTASGTVNAQEPGDAFSGLELSGMDELDDLRGKNSNTRISVESTQDLSATVTGSTFDVGTINSGGVTIGEHALDNFSGIGLFNIVTGNNNAVDAAVGVTFNLQ